MNKEIDKERFDKFDFTGFEDKDVMMFCHDCDWQSEIVIARFPKCPTCGAHLYLLDLTNDIIDRKINWL